MPVSDYASRPPAEAATGRPERIGFLGLGIMGSRMAANVVRAGFALTVWTHTPGKAQRWCDEHAAAAAGREPAVGDSPAAVARDSDIVISMVVDGAQVESVLLGADGVAEGAAPGLLCVDMSTIAPGDTRRIGDALAARGIALVDAPVTGSSPRAQDATLTIMAGGTESDVARARPLLETMGSLVVHVGELGHGQTVKVINNALAAANASAVAEALVLARAAGVDLDALLQVAGAGSGGSAMLALKADPMRRHDFTTLFKTEHMLKDVRLCLEVGEALGVPFPSASHASDMLQATVSRGLGDADFAAIIEAAEAAGGPGQSAPDTPA